MDEHENAFPMDFWAEDPSPHPWKFRPEGYLVVILSNAEEAHRALSSLVSQGFASRDVKLYTGQQILENYEVYAGRRKYRGQGGRLSRVRLRGSRALPGLRPSGSLCDVGAHPVRRGCPASSTSPRRP
jgi:hypothetical protein